MTLPGWLQAWVKVNPVTSLADAVRGLTVGGPVATHVLYALAWAAGIVIVAFPWPCGCTAAGSEPTYVEVPSRHM